MIWIGDMQRLNQWQLLSTSIFFSITPRSLSASSHLDLYSAPSSIFRPPVTQTLHPFSMASRQMVLLLGEVRNRRTDSGRIDLLKRELSYAMHDQRILSHEGFHSLEAGCRCDTHPALQRHLLGEHEVGAFLELILEEVKVSVHVLEGFLVRLRWGGREDE